VTDLVLTIGNVMDTITLYLQLQVIFSSSQDSW